MKRVLLSLFISAFAIIFSISSNNYLIKNLSEIEKELKACNELLIRSEIAAAKEKANELSESWLERKNTIGLFISGDVCKELEEELKKINFYLQTESTDSANDSIIECLNIITSVKENESLSADKIL